MSIKSILEKIATEENNPCVTISLNTHRTHPDNQQDGIVLKNLISEAKERIHEEFSDREVSGVLEKLDALHDKIDINYLLDSLHIYISNDTEEIVKSTWPVAENSVYIDDHFALRPLVIEYNRARRYMVLQLAVDGAKLYLCENGNVVEEVDSEAFPYHENPHYVPKQRESDAEYGDNVMKEFYRDVDKALVHYINELDKNLKVVVITTEGNYSGLQDVATRPQIYIGYGHIDHGEQKPHQLAEQAWEIVKENMQHERTEAIEELQAAVSEGKVITDLLDIYLAAKDGNGELLMVHSDFTQPVKMTGEREFEIKEDSKEPGVIDDITSLIAWEVISKGGRVVSTSQDQLKSLGEIVLKTRW